MLHNQRDFVIPETQRITELVSLLQNDFTVRVQSETVTHRSFYDTFDWRLYKNGSVLEMQEDDRSRRRIYWRAGKDAQLKIQLGLTSVPRLVNNLPASEFRQQLQSVISVRELTSRIRIRINRLPITVLDKDEKVVVRINLDKYWCRPSKLHADRLLGKRLTIKAVKGYAEYFKRVESFFQAMKFHPAQDNMMKLALAVKGMSAGEYTNKLNLRLDPEASVEKTLLEILPRLLEIMRHNTTGSIHGRDTEFIHDYHTSVRKTHYGLKQICDVVSQDACAKYNKFFSELDELTHPVRTLDVSVLQLDNYLENLEHSQQHQLQAFHEYLYHSREKLQKKFVESVKSSWYRENLKHWSDYLECQRTQNLSSENPCKAAYLLADQLIVDIYQQSIIQGKKITAKSKAEALHELHITLRQLCYLIEFFLSFYPVGEIRVLHRLITDLHTDLGEFEDLNTYMDVAREFVKQSTNDDEIQACEQMITIHLQQQINARENFKNHYSSYASSDTRKIFNDLFVDYHKGK